jgi:hypothetical protein
MSVDGLHARLAAAGVPLYAPVLGPASGVGGRDLESLIVDLLTARGSGALFVTIPCLLAAQDRSALAAVKAAASGLGLADRHRLGLLYRLARCLVMSRQPDLEDYLGRAVRLEPWEGEPHELPDPAESLGHSCLGEAKEAEERAGTAGVAGDAERAFDTWLRLLAVERARP